MKFIILAFLVFLGFAIPDKSIDVKINVKPRAENAAPPNRRDTLPNVEMGFVIRKESTASKKHLTYDFATIQGGVIVRNVQWLDAFGCQRAEYFGRINRVDADGYVVSTIFAGTLKLESMNIIIEHYGLYKIAVFQKGDYCNGIEYDLRWFGQDDVTPIHQFSHHLILCQ